MYRALLFLLKCIDNLSVFVGKTAAWLVVPIMLLPAFEAIIRSAIGIATVWSWELALMFYGAHFMLGGAWVMQQNRHVRADVLTVKLPVRVQAVMEIILFATIFAIFMYAMIPASWKHAMHSLATGERTFNEWAPPFYPLKTVIAVSFILMALQGFANTVRALLFLITGSTGRDNETYWVAPASAGKQGETS